MPDICFWNKCNNRCVMCTNPREFSMASPIGNYDLKTQLAKFEAYIQGKEDVYYSNRDRNDYINITGGEPTIHPDFFALIYHMRRKLKKIPITLLSNGRKFRDEKFAEKFFKIASPPFKVAVAVHSSRKDEFDFIAGAKGSFEQTVKGIDNLFKFSKDFIEIRVIIHKINVSHISEIADFIFSRWGGNRNLTVKIIHYEIEGMSEKNKKSVGVKLLVSAKKIEEAFENLKRLDFELYHYPLCVLDKKLRKYAKITLPAEERVYPQKKCGNCVLKKKCLGLMKRYFELNGDSELKPELKK